MKKLLSSNLLILGAVLSIFLGVAIPFVVEFKYSEIPDSRSSNTATAPSDGKMVMHNYLMEGKILEERADDPKCKVADMPVYCFVREGSAVSSGSVGFSPSDHPGANRTDIVRKYTFNNQEILQNEQKLRLDRKTAMPVPGSKTLSKTTVPGLVTTIKDSSTKQESFQATFQPHTEKKTYNFFDPLVEDSTPAEFVEETTIDGLNVYVFRQITKGARLGRFYDGAEEDVEVKHPVETKTIDYEGELAGMSLQGKAFHFYSKEERKKLGLERTSDVWMDPYYAIDRTIFVEPHSGIIVDKKERGGIYYAHSDEEAENIDLSEFSDYRSFYMGEFNWDEATIKNALAEARPIARSHFLASFAGWALLALATVLFITWIYLKRRV